MYCERMFGQFRTVMGGATAQDGSPEPAKYWRLCGLGGRRAWFIADWLEHPFYAFQ